MPIFKLIGHKWTVSQKLVQSIDDHAPLLKVLPLISRKLSVPSMKNFKIYACDGTTPVREINPEKSLKDQNVEAMSCLYISPADQVPASVTAAAAATEQGSDSASASASADPPPLPAASF